MSAPYTFTTEDVKLLSQWLYQGVSGIEMANRLGRSENTVKCVLRRIRNGGLEHELAKAAFQDQVNAEKANWAGLASKENYHSDVSNGGNQANSNTTVALPHNQRRDWWSKWNVTHDDGRLLALDKLPEKVLLFSCSQAPFHHQSTIPFLSMVIADTKPDMIVMAGDLVDFKFMKKRFMGPDDLSPTQELERAVDFCQQLFRVIPEAICLTSNHAEGRLGHAAREGNLPSAFLRRWQDVVGMPNGWVTREYLIMRNWLAEHGDGVSKGARSSIREEAVRRFGRPLSIIRGHRHGLFGEVMVPEWETRTQQRRLCYLGCTMDASQVEYTKAGLWNGCVLLYRGVPVPIPMERDGANRWTGRLAEW